MTLPNNVVELFPQRVVISPKKATAESDTLVSKKSTQLLALIEETDDQKGIFRFQKPMETVEEVTELITKLKGIGVNDITIRLENGTIINDAPEVAIGIDTFIFSEEACPVVTLLLLASFKDTDTHETKHSATGGENGEVYITRVAA